MYRYLAFLAFFLLLCFATSHATTPSLRATWTPPASYCYRKGNDWSRCAGDHLLYPPSSTKELLARPLMCVQEPFCWKQLDWRAIDPPTWPCPARKPLRFYDMSYHDAVMASAATMIEKSFNTAANTSHEVFLCNCKHARGAIKNYKYPFKTCPTNKDLECSWQTPFSETRVQQNERNYKNDTHFHGADALIFGFGSTMWEHWMGVHKTLVLALWHVANQHRCTRASSANTFQNIKKLASDSLHNHVIGANTLYHAEYIRHYTGLAPLLLPVTLIDAVGGATWTQRRPEFLINGHTHPPLPKNKKVHLVSPGHAGRYEMADLANYAGVVVVPYSITNGKVVEQYAMNIPIFVPSVHFAKRMINDRTATYAPYCPRMTNKEHPGHHSDSPYEYNPNIRVDTNGAGAEVDVSFWIQFSEIYHWPCIQQFDSWDEMYSLLETADRVEMNACMIQANKWRHFEELQNWCWATTHI